MAHGPGDFDFPRLSLEDWIEADDAKSALRDLAHQILDLLGE